MVHSLYSDREIFLRELVANAADAIDRRRFEALTDTRLAPPGEAKVRIVPDKAGPYPDSSPIPGIGMTKQELVQNLGTIARSGTRAFGETLEAAKPEDRPNLIGQFGVGFYSAFMVADRVEVVSRRAGSEEAWLWASDGAGEFTVSPAERDEAGTDVILHMKSDAGEFLDPSASRRSSANGRTTSPFRSRSSRDGKRRARRTRAARSGARTAPRSRSSRYKAFYRHLGHLFDTPWATLHWKAEGTLEFFALLFIPGTRPFDPLETDARVACPPACPPHVHHR